MYLKNIEVQGFKSFAQKINFEFHNGITGIVGPNGSGKSNISDAIRWVIGEMSAKSLRGSNMQDVIFAGTETRKPVNFAEVSLVLDNSSHLFDINYDEVVVTRPNDLKKMKSLHGLTRTLVANMVTGVTKGYEKVLEINGVGYRAQKQGKKLILSLGYSHPVEMEDPEGLESVLDGQNKITIKGIDKQKVGQYAAEIREKRKPEPYKGKGIKYADEVIRRKVGKTGKK